MREGGARVGEGAASAGRGGEQGRMVVSGAAGAAADGALGDDRDLNAGLLAGVDVLQGHAYLRGQERSGGATQSFFITNSVACLEIA